MTVYRFLYRPPERHNGGWAFLPGTGAYHTAESAARLVAEWNRKDRGRWVWRCELVLPGDIDHPETDFALANPPPKPAKWRGEPAPKCRQRVLLTGLDCLAGQTELFDT